MNQNVCRHHKYGFCKFGKTCRTKHNDEVCEITDCEINLCDKRHPRSCKFFSEFGRCKFGDYCRYKHVERIQNERIETEIDTLKELLGMKDKQIAAIAQKIDTIIHFLKTKDIDEHACEIDDKIEFHELDEDGEYDEKIEHICENESGLETLEENERIPGPSDYACNFCEKECESDIRLVAHIWKDHGGKSRVTIIPRNPA